MTPLRLLMVTDHFWPVVDAEAMALEQISHVMAGRGHSIRVLTRRSQKYWSPRLRIGDIEVDRLEFCTRSRFGNLRLARLMTQWLEAQRGEFDLLIVDPLDLFSLPVIPLAARTKTPICFWQVSDDPTAWPIVWPKLKRSLPNLKARSLWMVRDLARGDEIRGSGVGARRVLVGGPHIDCSAASAVARATARRALGENQPSLSVSAEDQLLIMFCNGKLSSEAREAIEAWRWVQRACPSAKFWIVGDDAAARQVADWLRGRQLANEVQLVGRFDDWSDLFSAADLLIQPDDSGRPSFVTLMAIQNALPILFIESAAGAQRCGAAGDSGFRHEVGEPRRLAEQLIDILQKRTDRAQAAESTKSLVARDHDLKSAAMLLEQFGREVCAERERVRS